MRAFLLLGLLSACGAEVSPFLHTDPCDPTSVHIWRVKNSQDGLYTVRVDTTDAATTFDPDLFIYSATSWKGGLTTDALLGYVDDSFACSFPPAEFECPQALIRTENTTEDLAILVGMVGSCAGTSASYALTVELDGAPVRARFEGTAPAEDYVEP